MKINTSYSFLGKCHSLFLAPFVPNPVWQTLIIMVPSESCLPPCVHASCNVTWPHLPSIDGVCFSTFLKSCCLCGLLWPTACVEVMCEFRSSGGLTTSTPLSPSPLCHKEAQLESDEKPHGGERGRQPTAYTNCQTQEWCHFRTHHLPAKVSCRSEPR